MTSDNSQSMQTSYSHIFECKQCGECCKGYGGTYVTDKNIKAISSLISTDPDKFVEKFCQLSGGKPLLTQGKDEWCIFFDKLCTIHPVKPRMCKAWPFLESVIKDFKNWEIMSASCPGINTALSESTVIKCIKSEIEKLNKAEQI